MVNRDKVEYRDSTPFNQDKLQDLQTIKDAILHKVTGKDVRAPIAQMPDAIIKWIEDADNLGQLGALLEIIEARGGFETLGIHESAQDNDINNNKDDIENTKQMIESLIDAVRKLNSNDPHGVFPNLDALKAKYPNGDKGIYITQDNGHWWFYNNGWVDGGKYLTSLFNFDGVDIDLAGTNLLSNSSSTPREVYVDNMSNTYQSRYKVNLQLGQTYTYHNYIINAPLDGFVLAEMYDINNNLIRQVEGTNFTKNSDGLSTVKFTVDYKTAYVNVYPFAAKTKFSGKVEWEKDMLEPGEHISKYVLGLSDLDSASALAFLIKKVEYRNAIDNPQLTGLNLLHGTSDNTKMVTLSDSRSNIGFFANEANKFHVKQDTDYVYHAKIVTSAIDQAFVVVNAFDKVGTLINQFLGNAFAFIQSHVSAVTFNSGKAEYITLSPIGFASAQKGDFSFSEEMLEYGKQVHPYRKSFDEMNTNEAINEVVKSVYRNAKQENSGTSLPVLTISGSYNDMLQQNVKTVLPFRFKQGDRDLNGYAQMEWQGDSSLRWPKKGFKFKTFRNENKTEKLKWQPSTKMPKSHNFQLKSYYTNKFHFNDLASGEILSWFIANNETAPDKLLSASQFGTITGTPCLIYFNEDFYGLGTIKTHTGSTMYNIDDDDPNQIAIEANGTDKARWTSSDVAIGDKGDFSLESDNDANAQAALDELASFIVDSSDEDFVKNIEKHIDLNSVCDYILFNYLINNNDAWDSGNTVYITYDAEKWFVMPYDFDASMGSSWDANGEPVYELLDYFFKNDKQDLMPNKLFRKIFDLMPDVLLARLNKLEQLGVLSLTNISALIDRYAETIGQGAYCMEWARWPDNKGYQRDLTIDNIKHMFVVRKQLLNKKLS